jgi:DNA-3-methyladenine glycosylase
MGLRPPARSQLTGAVLAVAPRLLGYRLIDRSGPTPVVVRITEVEAYDGSGNDPGSHAHRGPTPRNRSMFGPAGHAYVYFTYGMHWCLNIVVGPVGVASAVLVRAGEVVAGMDVARQRRPAARADRELARGPARLAAALGIDRRVDGIDLLATTSEIGLLLPEPGSTVDPAGAIGTVRTGPRVGLTHAADHPWRFWIDGDPTVSSYRPAVPRTAPRRGPTHTEE